MLTLDDLHVRFHGQSVLEAVSLSLEKGMIGGLIGPSGCGKTTLLRLIAGFLEPQNGTITLGSEPVTGEHIQVPAEQRRVGMVFQDVALFPHLNVAANIGFGLHRWSSAQRRARIKELLTLVGLPGLGKRYPHQLSGGQQQRVALARALAPKPRLLLLDEPFSALDAGLRDQISRDVRAILIKEGITALFVTHDQNEAFAIADRVGVMHAGRLVQWDTPYNIYHRPKTRFVANFIGRSSFIPGTVLSQARVETPLGVFQGELPKDATAGDAVEVMIRPDDILHHDDSPCTARVIGRAFRGAHMLYTLELDSGVQVPCLAPSHHAHPVGGRIGIRLEMDHLVAFPPGGQRGH